MTIEIIKHRGTGRWFSPHTETEWVLTGRDRWEEHSGRVATGREAIESRRLRRHRGRRRLTIVSE